MQSQPSSELSVEDMEKAMKEIEATTAPTPAPVPTATTEAKPASPIKAFIDAEQLARDVAIDDDHLDDAFSKQASLFVEYANKKAQARMQYEKMKAAFEILESRLYAKHRTKLAAEAAAGADGEKKAKAPTEAQIDAAVKADPAWWAGKNRVIEAQGVYDLATNTASAFEQRRDMLIQKGSDRREERKGELRLTEIGAARQRVAEGLKAVGS